MNKSALEAFYFIKHTANGSSLETNFLPSYLKLVEINSNPFYPTYNVSDS